MKKNIVCKKSEGKFRRTRLGKSTKNGWKPTKNKQKKRSKKHFFEILDKTLNFIFFEFHNFQKSNKKYKIARKSMNLIKRKKKGGPKEARVRFTIPADHLPTMQHVRNTSFDWIMRFQRRVSVSGGADNRFLGLVQTARRWRGDALRRRLTC